MFHTREELYGLHTAENLMIFIQERNFMVFGLLTKIMIISHRRGILWSIHC